MPKLSLQNNNWFTIHGKAPQGDGFLWGEPIQGLISQDTSVNEALW